MTDIVLGDWPIPRTADAVSATRHHIRALAARVVGCDSLSRDVELMAGELLANAVEHGGGDKTHVRVTADTRAVRVEVHDCGPGPAQDTATPTLMSERGRGLLLVAALATNWGITYAENGTVAWFEVKPD